MNEELRHAIATAETLESMKRHEVEYTAALPGRSFRYGADILLSVQSGDVIAMACSDGHIHFASRHLVDGQWYMSPAWAISTYCSFHLGQEISALAFSAENPQSVAYTLRQDGIDHVVAKTMDEENFHWRSFLGPNRPGKYCNTPVVCLKDGSILYGEIEEIRWGTDRWGIPGRSLSMWTGDNRHFVFGKRGRFEFWRPLWYAREVYG